MNDNIEITCKSQRDHKMSVKWCDLAQYQQLCAGCQHNEGRKRSKYQERRDLNTAKGGK